MSGLNEDFALFDPEIESQNAFDESKRNKFRKEALEPWTIARHSVALTLGCRLITAVGPFVSQFISGGNYSNMYRDVIIVLWLSSQDADQVMKLDVQMEPEQAMKAAYTWAEEFGIEYGSEAFIEGVSLLDRILKQILASFFEVDSSQESGEPKKKDIKPLGKFRLRSLHPEPAATPRSTSLIAWLWRKLCNGKLRSSSTSASTTSSSTISRAETTKQNG